MDLLGCFAPSDNSEFLSQNCGNKDFAQNKENCGSLLKKDLGILKTRERILSNSVIETAIEKARYESKFSQPLKEIDILHESNCDHDSEGLFKSTKPENNQGKSLVDLAFKNFDDMYENFVTAQGPSALITPKRTYSRVDESFIRTPEHKKQSIVDKNDVLPTEVKYARKKAMIDGHNDFREILDRAGIAASSYFSVLYSSHKKHSFQLNKSLSCSTPRNSPNVNTTPLNNSNRINTPLPISGIRELATSTPFGPSCVQRTPATPKRRSALTPISTPNFSPVSSQNVLPPEIKSCILKGVTCFVDVKTNKENHSESVKTELISLGAKIEKNFTRKVTHVVFKEGRASTYLKSKKLKVPLVSISWIEACKSAMMIVDPSLYPPVQMEKYEDVNPFQTLRKRRLQFLRTTEKSKKLVEKLGSTKGLEDSSSLKVTKLRRAMTDIKLADKHSLPRQSQEAHCTKKLNFGPNDQCEMKATACQQNEETDFTDSESLVSVREAEKNRRKSAPAYLLISKRKRKRKLETENNDKASTDVANNQNKVDIVTTSKKRKLFNPDESFISQEASQPSPCSSSSVYGIQPNSGQTIKKSVRTKLNSMRRFPKKLVACAKESKARKGLMELLDQEGTNTFLSCSRRSSINLFVIPKQSQVINRNRPTIVFTSLHPNDLKKYEDMTRNLGVFEIEPTVTERTTHVVSNGPRRTVNLLKGIARGCWILSIDWVEKSNIAGKWLSEEQYEMSSFSPAVLHCRLERQAFGKNFSMDIFSPVGGIYVARNCKPPWNDLVQLIRLCGGLVVTQARAANILVGPMRCSEEKYLSIDEKWVLDSITFNKLLDTSKYQIRNDDRG